MRSDEKEKLPLLGGDGCCSKLWGRVEEIAHYQTSQGTESIENFRTSMLVRGERKLHVFYSACEGNVDINNIVGQL